MSRSRPRILFTLGDVAGVGPEVLVKAWPELVALCRPVVVGDRAWVRRALELVGAPFEIATVKTPDEAHGLPGVIDALADRWIDLSTVVPCAVSAAAGRAAFDFLVHAINLTRAGLADAIVTLPLHKEGLYAAGLPYPGHTEILADKTGVRHYAMMLYARGPSVPHGLGVVHVTLHMALRRVFEHVTTPAITEKIHLLDGVMRKLCAGNNRAWLSPRSIRTLRTGAFRRRGKDDHRAGRGGGAGRGDRCDRAVAGGHAVRAGAARGV
ncbi:MAG: 4-hydroxythreonine-4-phosphate dehydrogenase PdxA [Gemmataceae bacterium]